MLKKGPGVCEHNQPNLYFVLNTFEFIDPAYTSYLYDGGGLVDIFAVDSKVFPISIFIWETDGNPMPVCSYAIGRKKPARVLCRPAALAKTISEVGVHFFLRNCCVWKENWPNQRKSKK